MAQCGGRRVALPAKDSAGPAEARAEGGERDQLAPREAPVGVGLGEQDRDRGGGAIPVALDVVAQLLGREPERLRDELVDAQVGLVEEEEVDVLRLRTGP